MKRRKHDRPSLSLFEPSVRWSDLPLDVRQTLVDTWAQLLVQVRACANEHSTLSATPAPDTSQTQENHDDSP
jgi:hypothetical protein